MPGASMNVMLTATFPGTTATKLMEVYDLDRAVRNGVLDGVGVLRAV